MRALVAFAFFFLATPATAQYGWQWRNPQPQGSDLTSIAVDGG